MILKKSSVSYLAWIVLVFVTGAACAFFGMVLAHLTKINVVLAAAGLVTGFFGLGYLLFFITGHYAGKENPNNHLISKLNLTGTIEWIMLLVFVAIAFVIRVLMLADAGEEAAYFEVTKVTATAGMPFQSVQAGVYFYCLLLHGLFRIVGNHWIAGIWLQIILQLVGIVILYHGLKKLINRIPAFLVVLFLLYAPFSIEASLTYSPKMLHLCMFSLGFYVVADYLGRIIKRSEMSVALWIYTILTGIIIGICCYIDITGVLLIIPVLCMPLLKQENEEKGLLKNELCIIAVSMISLLATVWLDSILSHTTISRVLGAWKIIYDSFAFDFNTIVYDLDVEIVILLMLACMGCFSFWRRKKTDCFTPFIFMAICMGGLFFFGITTKDMNGSYLLYVILSILAVVSITELFYNEELNSDSVSNEETESMEVEEREYKNIEYIENPLPVPKKHVRKTMDYAFIPDEAHMKFDIQVSEQDDFDIK